MTSKTHNIVNFYPLHMQYCMRATLQ